VILANAPRSAPLSGNLCHQFNVVTARTGAPLGDVELLLIRSYDAALDARLPEVHRRIARAQRRFTMPLVRRYSQLLSDVQRLVAEVTEVTEQIDNALKVTDDVYWNRLYSAALGVRPTRRFSVGRGGAAGSATCACTRARHARADVNARAERTKPRWRGAGVEQPHAPARARQRPLCFQPDAYGD